jgi:hypothetical protein
MIDLQTVINYIAIISVPVGVAYHILTLNNTRKSQQMQLETRQAQLFMQIYSTWSSDELVKIRRELMSWTWTDYDDFHKKYGEKNNPEAFLSYIKLGTWFEGVGVLVKRKLIDPTFVDDLMSGSTMWGWETFGSIVKERRVRDNTPYYYEFWEYLYDEVSAIAHKQHPELAT